MTVDLLAQYLESDIQDSPEMALRLLDLVERVASGELAAWEETGNAYTLTLAPDGATIQPEFGYHAEAGQFSLDELRDALLARLGPTMET